MQRKVVLFVMTVLFSTAAQAELALLPGDPENGKVLVQEKCSACHARMLGDPAKIYSRPNRRVKSIEGLMKQVAMCDQQLDTRLSREERDNIVIFLNQAYYRF